MTKPKAGKVTEALRWFEERGRVCMFDNTAPSLKMIVELRERGLLETAGREPGQLGFTCYQLSPAGRALLKEEREKNAR